MVSYCVMTFDNTMNHYIIWLCYTCLFVVACLYIGKGTQVCKKSGAIYSGEWKFGKRDGYGTYSTLLQETKEYAKKYAGGWKDGKKHVCI